MVVRGAAEAFLSIGAKQVIVAEGPGHGLDYLYILEESGLKEVLKEDQLPYFDLNGDASSVRLNRAGFTSLKSLAFSSIFDQVDWIVSVAKMKTHHWAGVTLSMKNLFGTLPGIVYGWPKNVLHHQGIGQSIIDINATLKPHFAIVDGIVGMKGDGPIMGQAKQAGVLILGRNLPAVDATCARVMGIDPEKIDYLRVADTLLGPISESAIEQRGESISRVKVNFALEERIPAHRGIRLLG